MTIFVLLRPSSDPWGRRGGDKNRCQNAPRRDEVNDPIGETIGAEMAKRARDTHTNKQKYCREILKRIYIHLS